MLIKSGDHLLAAIIFPMVCNCPCIFPQALRSSVAARIGSWSRCPINISTREAGVATMRLNTIFTVCFALDCFSLSELNGAISSRGDWKRLRSVVRWIFTSVLLAVFGSLVGCVETIDAPAALPREESLSRPTSAAAITEFCCACHLFPKPTSFPRDRWRHEVEQGFQIYRDSQRRDLIPTDLEATVAWFESLAPDAYDFSECVSKDDQDESAPSLFKRIEVPVEPGPGLRSITHIKQVDINSMLICDVDTGLVCQTSLRGTTLIQNKLSKVANPVHVESSDLDGDGVSDFVVADIGSINPSDFQCGTLWWVHRSTDNRADKGPNPMLNNGWETVPLKTGYSRVCDARPFDYDADGDEDLIVAEFGFRFEGSIHLLRNVGLKNGIPQFESQVIDKRNGSIHVPVVDMNRDGRLDIVTLVSQEHESIDVHLNQGNGDFIVERIHTSPDPAYASSGIDVIDLDGDGDLDILYTNGDTFDDHIAKPFHSVQWLENQGTFPFTHHHLVYMPGVYRAIAGDIDNDGDMDIVAVSLISAGSGDTDNLPLKMDMDQLDAVIWLEQTDDHRFVRHPILKGECEWATCELLDLDKDDDLDLVLGRYRQTSQCPDQFVYYQNLANP